MPALSASSSGACPAPRLLEVRDNLITRIEEARREGWLGEMEGLQVSLAGARHKLTQLDQITNRRSTIDLGMPAKTQPRSA